jgi:hypothetical protein
MWSRAACRPTRWTRDNGSASRANVVVTGIVVIIIIIIIIIIIVIIITLLQLI